MVRLILVLAPIACILGAIGISTTLKTYMKYLNRSDITRRHEKEFSGQTQVAVIVVLVITGLLVLFSMHCTWVRLRQWRGPNERRSREGRGAREGEQRRALLASPNTRRQVTSEAYSSPSIVLAARQPDGSNMIFDDFREAYYWLRMNTPDDTRIMSWWDYGYQLAAMANRTVLVDNNTWNNTHIAQVGKAMASPEDVSIEIMRKMDVDYVLVIFGGLIGYSSDDINKFLWMIRIAGSCDPNVKEEDYFTKDGQYEVSDLAPPAMINSLMYRLSYYRFGEVMLERGRPRGFDRVRHREIGLKDFDLQYVEEAYTTVNWLVRLYKVKEPSNRA